MNEITIDAYTEETLIEKVESKIEEGFEPIGDAYTTKNLNKQQDSPYRLIFSQKMERG